MVSNKVERYTLNKDRIKLYLNFTLDLLYTIDEYYLDADSFNSDSIIKNHYSWCFNRVCDNYKCEGIDFSKNEKLNSYFGKYFYSQLYATNKFDVIETKKIPLEGYVKFWNTIFNSNKPSNTANVLIEIYKIFDLSINEK